MNVETNARTVAGGFRRMAVALDAALARGIRQATVAVDRAQVRNLSGTGRAEPGSYPVPVRKGTLRGGHGWAVQGTEGQVFNTTAYAESVHSGRMKTAQGIDYAVRPRAFLDDAVEQTDVEGIVVGEVGKVFAV